MQISESHLKRVNNLDPLKFFCSCLGKKNAQRFHFGSEGAGSVCELTHFHPMLIVELPPSVITTVVFKKRPSPFFKKPARRLRRPWISGQEGFRNSRDVLLLCRCPSLHSAAAEDGEWRLVCGRTPPHSPTRLTPALLPCCRDSTPSDATRVCEAKFLSCVCVCSIAVV